MKNTNDLTWREKWAIICDFVDFLFPESKIAEENKGRLLDIDFDKSMAAFCEKNDYNPESVTDLWRDFEDLSNMFGVRSPTEFDRTADDYKDTSFDVFAYELAELSDYHIKMISGIISEGKG